MCLPTSWPEQVGETASAYSVCLFFLPHFSLCHHVFYYVAAICFPFSSLPVFKMLTSTSINKRIFVAIKERLTSLIDRFLAAGSHLPVLFLPCSCSAFSVPYKYLNCYILFVFAHSLSIHQCSVNYPHIYLPSASSKHRLCCSPSTIRNCISKYPSLLVPAG
jgi:hypothetical protein